MRSTRPNLILSLPSLNEQCNNKKEEKGKPWALLDIWDAQLCLSVRRVPAGLTNEQQREGKKNIFFSSDRIVLRGLVYICRVSLCVNQSINYNSYFLVARAFFGGQVCVTSWFS